MTSLKQWLVVAVGMLVAINPLVLYAADPALKLSGKLASQAEPGPEDGGLRLRLVVEPQTGADKKGFDVRLDLVNVSERAATIQTGWERGGSGDVKEYLEAAASIDCLPQIEPWRGGLSEVLKDRRSSQAKQVLQAGETLSVRWHSDGKQLKNRVSDPTIVQNPTFSVPGLYAVHATLDVITSQGVVRLRSNEQLVPVGGSRAMPKHTYGRVWSANRESKSAVLGLGALHKVAVGDRFEITSKTAAWRLTATEVQPGYSECTLELASSEGEPESAEMLRSAYATLVQEQVK